MQWTKSLLEENGNLLNYSIEYLPGNNLSIIECDAKSGRREKRRGMKGEWKREDCYKHEECIAPDGSLTVYGNMVRAYNLVNTSIQNHNVYQSWIVEAIFQQGVIVFFAMFKGRNQKKDKEKMLFLYESGCEGRLIHLSIDTTLAYGTQELGDHFKALFHEAEVMRDKK